MAKPFKEFRADGWPYCPRCEEDELYSFLMLGWIRDEPPRIEECIATGMKCYRCSWELQPVRLAVEAMPWPDTLEEKP